MLLPAGRLHGKRTFALAAIALAAIGTGWYVNRGSDGLPAQLGNDPLCDIRFCGNGLVDPGEQCDPFDPLAGDRCDPLCRIRCTTDGDCPSGECSGGICKNLCGNGIVEPSVCVGVGGTTCPLPDEGSVRHVNLPAEIFPLDHVPADVDGDGNTDVVVVNNMGVDAALTQGTFYTGTINVMLGNGDGTFRPKVTVGTFSWNDGGGPRGFDVLDVDEDGDGDIVIHTYPDLFLLTNNDMVFDRSLLLEDYHTNYLRHADFNGDGDQDVYFTGYKWPYVQGSARTFVLYGGPGAAFSAPVQAFQEVAHSYDTAQFADMDEDGDVDVVGVASWENGYTVRFLRNRGDGTFDPGVELFRRTANPNVRRTILAEATGDGHLDVVLEENENAVTVLTGDGDGGVTRSTVVPLQFKSYLTAVADPSGDGIPDLIIGLNQGSEGAQKRLWMAEGSGNGTFAPPLPFLTWDAPPTSHDYPPPFYQWTFYAADLEMADYDGDGRTDLSMPHASYSDSVSVFLFGTQPAEPCVEVPPVLTCSQAEECDDGAQNGQPGKCTRRCTYCGNGVIDTVNGRVEECDLGAQNGEPGSACSRLCEALDPPGRLGCMGVGQCVTVPAGSTAPTCDFGTDCCDPLDPACKHAVCENNACVAKTGPGDTTCALNSDDCAPCPASNPNCHRQCDVFVPQCLATSEPGQECTTAVECGHLACVSGQCAALPGPLLPGEVSCDTSVDCPPPTRLGCMGVGQCVTVPAGSTAPTCDFGTDCCDPLDPACKHAVCENNACVAKTGPGDTTCALNSDDCAPCPASNPNCHSQCDVSVPRCLAVSAPGNECAAGADCGHLACVNQQCASLPGPLLPGEVSCDTSADCTDILCPNGTVDAGEACDDGNAVNDDACNNQCQRTCTDDTQCTCDEANGICIETCGDGNVDAGEDCDEGPGNRTTPPTNLTGWYCKAPSCTRSVCFDNADNDNDQLPDALDAGCWEYDMNAVADRGSRGFLGSLLAQSTILTPIAPEQFLAGKDDEACPAGTVDRGSFCALTCDPGDICPTGDPCPQDGVCPVTCGNGVIDMDLGEECDDQNLVNDDACTNLCRLAPCTGPNCPRCGDGVFQQQLGEQCDGDDPPSVALQGCTANCRLRCDSDDDCIGTCDEAVGMCVPPVCGDGEVNQSWERCDDGDVNNGNACNNQCQPTCIGDADCESGKCDKARQVCFGLCGNGNVDDGEQCDDGNLLNGDSCSNQCQRSCTDDSTCDCDETAGVCRLACGNGRVDVGESCDDGNKDDRDACTNRCQARCRPGTLCPDSQACPQNGVCPTPGVCGDGVVNAAGEQCDDGNAVDTDACSSSCTVRCSQNLECPNGLLCVGEECVECSNSLQCPNGFCVEGRCKQALPLCGNGVMEPGEACDDGNGADGDSCTVNCRFPINHACAASAQCQTNLCQGGTCQPCGTTGQCASGLRCAQGNCLFGSLQCGDGVVQAGEACDDANFNDQDQCTAACLKPFGAACDHATQCASTICSGGACAPCRADAECAAGLRCAVGLCLTDAQMATIPNICGNGFMEGGESCDDGNAAYGDGCTPSCTVGDAPSRSEVAANVTVYMPFDPSLGGTNAVIGGMHAGAGDGLSDTGPATVAVMAAGAAAGTAWVRRRMKAKRR